MARAGFVVFSYFILNPLLLLLIIRYILVINEITFLWLFGIYGYSYTVYVVTTALNVVPLDWLRWAFLIGSAIVSFFVIMSELWRVMHQ